MSIARKYAQATLDAAFAERVRLEFATLFEAMFTGQRNRPRAIETFRRGIADHLDAHATASQVIAELIPET